jgi:hypothetical protein
LYIAWNTPAGGHTNHKQPKQFYYTPRREYSLPLAS